MSQTAPHRRERPDDIHDPHMRRMVCVVLVTRRVAIHVDLPAIAAVIGARVAEKSSIRPARGPDS